MIGIVASRLVERYGRPVVLIAGSASGGDWKGSGRAAGPFDLHGALDGVRRAPRALRRPPRRRRPLDPARAASRRSPRRSPRTPTRTLTDDDLRPRIAVDAIVRGPELGLALCQELARLAPFGLGNPGVTLLVDDCELDRLDTVGDGKHLRFRVRQRGRDAGSAIAFGFGGQIDRYRRPNRYDVAFRLHREPLERHVAPQLVVRRIFDTDERYEELHAWFGEQWRRGEARGRPRCAAVFDELGLVSTSGVRRCLLESELFRQLLLEEPPLAAAA